VLYRNTNGAGPSYDQSACLFMRLLYDVFGYPDEEGGESEFKALPLLNAAVNGAQLIDAMPNIPEVSGEGGKSKNKKPDYEHQSRQRRRIGDRGEQIVLLLERRRLTQAGKRALANKVERVSEKDDRLGYDIISFEEDGAHRYIEVKATSGINLGGGFFLSNTERQKAATLSNYHIYFVFLALTANPRVLPVPGSSVNEDFVLEPILFVVSPKKLG
jgi:Domain of unknown function (DUF3883)